jgi:hypothetical protein
VAPLIALLILVAVVFALPHVDLKSNLGYEMMNLGESLARDGSFSNPLAAYDTGPTATEPPLYPLFLALCIKIAQDTSLVLLSATAITTFAGAVTAVLLHSLVARLLGTGAATFAAVLWMVSAWMGSTVNWIFWDAAFTPLVLIAFCHSTVDTSDGDSFIRSCLLPGTLLGALFLLNPAALAVAAAWWICRAFAWHGAGRMTRRQSLGILLVAAVVGAPWIVRNWAIWGRPIVRENFGYTFFASNNPCAQPLLAENLGNGCYEHTHPNENRVEAQLMRSLGEPEYDRVKTAASLAWIRSNKARFASLTARRILLFWFPSPKDLRWQAYGTWVATLLSIPGLLWMWRNRAPLDRFVAATAALYPTVYYIVVADIRYRAPFAWVAVLPAAYLCDRVYERLKLRFG